MKALLTSGGISNLTIETELWRLLGGRRSGIKMLFISTAYRMEPASTADWANEDAQSLRDLGFDVDVIDVTGLAESEWLPKFEWAEVYYFEGGSTGWLRKQIKECGLEERLHELLKTRVWVGVSAGSIVLCPTICNTVQDLFDEDDFSIAGTMKGLGYVDFNFIPHLNSPHFPKVRAENIDVAAKNLRKVDGEELIAVDDDSAVSVDGDKVKIVGDGEMVKISLADTEGHTNNTDAMAPDRHI